MSPANLFAAEVALFARESSARITDLSGQTRRIAGRLRPHSAAEVVEIVKAAGRHGQRLHAISCGRNWGFGSALPPEDNIWIVDLGAMDCVHSYQAEIGSITVEPGVSQIKLYRELQRLGGDWLFNVTGAGHSTSVLGNALERGIGYQGQRHHDLLEVDVVTGDGTLLTSRLVSGCQLNAPACLGLDLTQLFVQTGLAIVVSARIRLLKRTDGIGAAIVRLREERRVRDFFHSIIELKQMGCIQGVPHVANRARIIATMAPWIPAEDRAAFAAKSASWTAALPMAGCREMTETAFRVIRERLGEFCEIETLLADAEDHEGAAGPLSPQRQLQQLASCFPSNLAIPGVEWAACGIADLHRNDPEPGSAGLIHVTPATFSSEGDIQRALELIARSAATAGLPELPITVNVVDAQMSVFVLSVSFARSDAAEMMARVRGFEALLKLGHLYPYRIGLGQEDWLQAASASTQLVHERLKAVFDPQNVLFLSKYQPRRAARPIRKSRCRVQPELAAMESV